MTAPIEAPAAEPAAAGVRSALCTPQIEAWLQQLLDGVEPAVAAELRDFADATRAQFLHIADDVDDAEDQQLMVAAQYIERKARWIQLNTAIQYRRIASGRSDLRLIHEASIVSLLLGAIEPLIDPLSLERINELLEQPVL